MSHPGSAGPTISPSRIIYFARALRPGPDGPLPDLGRCIEPYRVLLSTTLFWGGYRVAGKLEVGHVSPTLLTAIRLGFALDILSAVGWRQLRADWPLVRQNMLLLADLARLR